MWQVADKPVSKPCKYEFMDRLYTDGGVIGANPSKIGGTWAIRLVDGYTGEASVGTSGVVLAGSNTVSNNLMELIAVVRGLTYCIENFGSGWVGTVCSDSQITLGRVFHNWSMNGIPEDLVLELLQLHRNFKFWDRFGYQLLEGHPTQRELQAGVGNRGYPVSTHNKWCDDECNRLKGAYKG